MGAVVALMMALTVPVEAGSHAAPVTPPPCGELSDKEFFLEYYTRYLVDAELAPVRAKLGLERLTDGFERYVVEDEEECGRVFGQLRAHLARTGQRQRLQEEDATFAIFRYGPYYGVLLNSHDAGEFGEKVSTGWATLFFFRASDLAFLGSLQA